MRSSRLTDEQEIALGDWVDVHCPQSIRKVGAWVKRTFGRSYSRSGLIALLHRLGFDYRKPEAMPPGLDDARQQAFSDQYENLLNTMGADEAVVFVDAVHPTQVRPGGSWARRDVAIGAIDLETGQTQILAVEKVSAPGFIKLLGEIEGTHTAMRLIQVFLPPYCPHLDPIERLWALLLTSFESRLKSSSRTPPLIVLAGKSDHLLGPDVQRAFVAN